MNNAHLLPQHKDDQYAVQQLQGLSKTQLIPIAKEILEWVQDGNWPIAGAMGLLLSKNLPIVEKEIISVLSGRDETWKYWIIGLIIGVAPIATIPYSIRKELERIVAFPSPDELEEGVVDIAEDTLLEINKRLS